jgi:tetratricopeptide (TPR) repeat protein
VNPAPTTAADEDLPRHLIASLHLSLERLAPDARASLPKLGVFQGGAFEDDLLAITGLEASAWAGLRPQLETAALLEAESLEGVIPPFLRFHPTLAPLLWLELDSAEQARLSAAHRARYYALAGYLHDEDRRNPHAARAIARRELPNLLQAVRAALIACDPQAVDFVTYVNRFLDCFGLRREQQELARLAERQAQETGSRAWYLAQTNRGGRLLATGQVAEAAEVFQALLAQLGETAGYERAQTLEWLGRCFRIGGRPDRAAQSHRQALAMLDRLEPDDGVKRGCGICLTSLANALMELGEYAQARQAYRQGLAIAQELNDTRGQGVSLGQLGSLAMEENQPAQALQNYRQALSLFQQLQEPASEAVAWDLLGRVYQETRQWEQAERCYREAARIKENLGDRGGAATTWNNLAAVNASAGQPQAAEIWYRQAMAQFRADQDVLHLAGVLNNLANLLRGQPQRLGEARALAEEALALDQTLEPGAAQIWRTYHILADIAEQEAEAGVQPERRRQQARAYRLQSQAAYRDFPGNQPFLKQLAPLILAACAALAPTQRTWFQRLRNQPPAAAHPAALAELAEWQAALREAGPDEARLADALDRLKAGQRDGLLDGLGYRTALILDALLRGLADPASLDWLREDADSAAS